MINSQSVVESLLFSIQSGTTGWDKISVCSAVSSCSQQRLPLVVYHMLPNTHVWLHVKPKALLFGEGPKHIVLTSKYNNTNMLVYTLQSYSTLLSRYFTVIVRTLLCWWSRWIVSFNYQLPKQKTIQSETIKIKYRWRNRKDQRKQVQTEDRKLVNNDLKRLKLTGEFSLRVTWSLAVNYRKVWFVYVKYDILQWFTLTHSHSLWDQLNW